MMRISTSPLRALPSRSQSLSQHIVSLHLQSQFEKVGKKYPGDVWPPTRLGGYAASQRETDTFLSLRTSYLTRVASNNVDVAIDNSNHPSEEEALWRTLFETAVYGQVESNSTRVYDEHDAFCRISSKGVKEDRPLTREAMVLTGGRVPRTQRMVRGDGQVLEELMDAYLVRRRNVSSSPSPVAFLEKMINAIEKLAATINPVRLEKLCFNAFTLLISSNVQKIKENTSGQDTPQDLPTHSWEATIALVQCCLCVARVKSTIATDLSWIVAKNTFMRSTSEFPGPSSSVVSTLPSVLNGRCQQTSYEIQAAECLSVAFRLLHMISFLEPVSTQNSSDVSDGHVEEDSEISSGKQQPLTFIEIVHIALQTLTQTYHSTSITQGTVSEGEMAVFRKRHTNGPVLLPLVELLSRRVERKTTIVQEGNDNNNSGNPQEAIIHLPDIHFNNVSLPALRAAIVAATARCEVLECRINLEGKSNYYLHYHDEVLKNCTVKAVEWGVSNDPNFALEKLQSLRIPLQTAIETPSSSLSSAVKHEICQRTMAIIRGVAAHRPRESTIVDQIRVIPVSFKEAFQSCHQLAIDLLVACGAINDAYLIVVTHKYHGLGVTKEVIAPLLRALSEKGDCRSLNLVDVCTLYSNNKIDLEGIRSIFTMCEKAGDHHRAKALYGLLNDIVPGFIAKAPKEIKQSLRALKVLPLEPNHMFSTCITGRSSVPSIIPEGEVDTSTSPPIKGANFTNNTSNNNNNNRNNSSSSNNNNRNTSSSSGSNTYHKQRSSSGRYSHQNHRNRNNGGSNDRRGQRDYHQKQ